MELFFRSDDGRRGCTDLMGKSIRIEKGWGDGWGGVGCFTGFAERMMRD